MVIVHFLLPPHTQIKHWKDIIAVQEKLKSNQLKMIGVKDKCDFPQSEKNTNYSNFELFRILEAQKQRKELEDVESRDVAQEFSYRAKGRELNLAHADHEKLMEEEKALTKYVDFLHKFTLKMFIMFICAQNSASSTLQVCILQNNL